VVLVQAAPALGERRDAAAGLVDGERAERAEPVAHLIDGNGCYTVGRERGGDVSAYVVLVASRTVADNRHRPARSRSWTSREVQIEIDIVRALHYRSPGARANGRDVFTWMDHVIGRRVLPEGELAHGAGDDPQL